MRNEQTTDERAMRFALGLAENGRFTPAPNPMVGAIVVNDGRIVGQGWHKQAGGPHAERVALADAGIEAHGATIYVTLEPCSHTGRTGPCTEAILKPASAASLSARPIRTRRRRAAPRSSETRDSMS